MLTFWIACFVVLSVCDDKFVSHSAFLSFLRDAHAEDFVGKDGNLVESEAEFNKMKQRILDLNENVNVTHSFMLDRTRTVDCVPINQQASLNVTNGTLATAPPTRSYPISRNKTNNGVHVHGQGDNDGRDKEGNQRRCPPGYVPIIRKSLESLSKNFRTLAQSDSKYPEGKGGLPSERRKRGSTTSHHYAVGYQEVENFGGHSVLNVWDPEPEDPADFSLSQVWYAGQTSSVTQTVECGWQVYPDKYGTWSPVLFVYYTPDSYATGCYNYDCGAFVQYSNTWIPGAIISPVSTDGGQQYQIDIVVQHDNGNWWIAVGGVWMGYYPGYLYNYGQLTVSSNLIEFGGEVTPNANGLTGEMGSGLSPPYYGWEWAAYQNSISYYDYNSGNNYWAVLSPITTCPDDYTIDITNESPTTWGTYFYFGGDYALASDCTN